MLKHVLSYSMEEVSDSRFCWFLRWRGRRSGFRDGHLGRYDRGEGGGWWRMGAVGLWYVLWSGV